VRVHNETLGCASIGQEHEAADRNDPAVQTRSSVSDGVSLDSAICNGERAVRSDAEVATAGSRVGNVCRLNLGRRYRSELGIRDERRGG